MADVGRPDGQAAGWRAVQVARLLACRGWTDGWRAVELIAPAQEALTRWRPSVPSGHPRHPIRSSGAAAVWNGVVWGRLGRGDRAWEWWDSVDEEHLQPWIAAERGRVLRELGLHVNARELEEAALRETHDLVDMVMLRLSLAADAVGLGEESAARRSLGTAGSLLGELPVDERVQRQRLRRRWVEVEVELLGGSRPSPDGLPTAGDNGPVFPMDYGAGTDFHRAKGLLFAGVVREDPDLLRRASELAPPALRWAVELARLDTGDDDAARRATAAWNQVVPPPDHVDAVEASAVAQRMRGLARRR